MNLLNVIISTARSVDIRSRELKLQHAGKRVSDTPPETQKQIFEAAEAKRAMRRAGNLNNAKRPQRLEEL